MDNQTASHEINDTEGGTPQKKPNQEAQIQTTPLSTKSKPQEVKLEIDDEESQRINPLKEIYTKVKENHPFIFFTANAIVIFASISLVISIFAEEEIPKQSSSENQTIIQDEKETAQQQEGKEEVAVDQITTEEDLQKEIEGNQLAFAKEAIAQSIELNQEDTKYLLFNHQINTLSEGKASTNFLMPEIILLTRSEQARSIPLMNNLKQISNMMVREKYIHDYISTLVMINSEIENSLHNITTNNKIIKEEYRRLQKENRLIQKQINTIESIQDETQLQEIIQNAKDTKHSEDNIELKMKLNEKIKRKLEKSKELLVARLEGVNRNQEALMHTITVSAVKNMNLEIIQGKVPRNSIVTVRELEKKKETNTKPMPGVKNSFANIAKRNGTSTGGASNIARAITGNNMASQVMQMKSMASPTSSATTNTFGGTFKQLFTGVKYL